MAYLNGKVTVLDIKTVENRNTLYKESLFYCENI